jgi:uncharacterized protein
MTENLLRHETSPYLLQHADNPVHWRPWSPEAFEEARSAGKPILLSVGYAACHWCHVMAHESFEDSDVARVMNEHYVNIKLDREERPDVDQLYMNALQLLGEPGGWPLTMFLTPDGDPVWGGTYFPKDARYGRPGFVDVLEEFARLYRDAPERIAHNRDAIRARLSAQPGGQAGQLDADILNRTAMRLLQVIDPINGGLKGAPKFPQTGLLRLLWQAGLSTGDNRLLDFVEHTLARMSRGGICDQLGGGFSRYTVDDRWLVPHFEKMLYDNALILDLLTLAWLRSHNTLYRDRIESTVDWLMREMADEAGAFAASLDADSEGGEGLFYTWTRDEIDAVLGEDAELFARAYGVTADGNFEGRTILNRLHDPFPLDDTDEARLAHCREHLLAVRAKRVPPARDDKILADWNGLMISALVRAGAALDRPDWIARAREAYRFVCESMARDGRLAHSLCNGKLVFPGLSSDYATLISAALTLHEATSDASYLADAEGWVDIMDRWHWDAETDGYCLAAADTTDLTIRLKHGHDDAIPNPNAVMAENCVRLWHMTGKSAYRDKADSIFQAYAGGCIENPLAYAGLLSAFDFRLETLQIIVTRGGTEPRNRALSTAAWSVPDPNRIVIEIPETSSLPSEHPAAGKEPVNGQAAAYVCIGERCTMPITDARELASHAQRTRAQSWPD